MEYFHIAAGGFNVNKSCLNSGPHGGEWLTFGFGFEPASNFFLYSCLCGVSPAIQFSPTAHADTRTCRLGQIAALSCTCI